MALTTGNTLGPYAILSPLGAGGMGEVYRARDTKLGRDVALKVLPDAFAADADRLARFRREAQVLASLNHPHVAQIYGIEDGGVQVALVMELVEGPTLADRIVTGSLPLDEILAIAQQIADALEAAHGQGIIHRDLKPANIKVRADGTVKVLDFGLAKAMERSEGHDFGRGPVAEAEASARRTITSPAMMTGAGIILGTAAYMAPEQARGHVVDTRADIWAFGVVLFEMLAGRRPFDGDEMSDTLAGVLKSEPSWNVLPSATPPAIHRLLRRCLQKDRRQRLQHMGDARLEIEDARRATPADTPAGLVHVSRRERLVWGGAVLLAAVATAAGLGWGAADAPEPPELRVDINTTTSDPAFAISPDGNTIAYQAVGQRGRQLWVRSLADSSSRLLAGTEGGQYPFWSPDNRSIGFFVDNKLKRVDLDGGQPQSLANVITPAGGTWNSEGTILYVPSDSGGVFQVSATGGSSGAVTPRRSPQLATRMPQFLPDGRRFLFYVAAGGEPAGVYTGELGSDAIRRILSADWPALYGSGHVWFVRERTLFAQRFDPPTGELSGAVTQVADNLGGALFAAAVSTSREGSIAYRAQTVRSRRELVWFDRSGKQVGTAGEEGALLSNPSLSPDGGHVAVQRTVGNNIDLWVVDLQRNVQTRLTDNPGVDSMPVWSPDGNRIVFGSQPSGGSALAIMHIDRTIATEPLPISSGEGVKIACDWSADGRFLLYKQIDPAAGTTDLWVMPMSGDRTPLPLVQTRYDERDGQFSPDGKRVAYESDESGRTEIYLQPFPGPGPKVLVSTAGGTQVRWRRDGKEVYYIAPDESLMAVVIDPAAGPSGVGTPTPLFRTSIAPIRSISRQQYVVSPDGQRFLILTQDQPPTSPLTLILNWKGTGADSR